MHLSISLKITDFSERGEWRDPVKQKTRKIDWKADTTQAVIDKVKRDIICPLKPMFNDCSI